MNIFKDLADKIDAAKPHFAHGVKTADKYACRIIALLEVIARDDDDPDDQRVKRFALVNGAPQEFETPSGENWNMVALIVEPVGATTITLKLGGVSRFAKQFASADTPQIPSTVIANGATLTLLSTGTDAVVTIIASLKRNRAHRRAIAGDVMAPLGLPMNDGAVPERHWTDEASELPRDVTWDDVQGLQETEPDQPTTNAAPVL